VRFPPNPPMLLQPRNFSFGEKLLLENGAGVLGYWRHGVWG